jgi:hypothetical protein
MVQIPKLITTIVRNEIGKIIEHRFFIKKILFGLMILLQKYEKRKIS